MGKVICEDKKRCTGCTACVNVCPAKCIQMKEDAEGFLYPDVNEDDCLNCGLCEQTCPVNFPPPKEAVKESYVVRYKDLMVVDSSTSGGTCTAFADYVFGKKGFLYGAGYDKWMKVRHFGIDVSEKHRVSEMRGSKYVQSDVTGVFQEIEEKIKKGDLVCFFGTPCQIAGIRKYLKRDFENFITIGLVCHGVASPMFFENYVKYQTDKYNSKPVDIRFRNKTYGYHSGTMMVSFSNGKRYYGSGRVDYMLKAYFSGACSRYSCYTCPYKGVERCSDFTVFDSWHVNKLVSGMEDDDRGYTNIFIHTDKGIKIFEEMKMLFELWKADPREMQHLDGVMIDENPIMHPCRETLLLDVNSIGFEEVVRDNLPVMLKDQLIEISKRFLYKLGVMKYLKR